MIRVEWASDSRTVIYWYLPNGWTWADFYIAQKEVDTMIDTVSGTVDGIFLPDNPRYLPPNALTNLRNITLRRHPRYGYSMVVGVNPYVRSLLNTLAHLLPNDNIIRFVATEEEAHTLIAETQSRRTQHLQT